MQPPSCAKAEALAPAPGDAIVVVTIEAEFLLEVVSEIRIYLAVEPALLTAGDDFTYCVKASQ